MQVIAVVGLGYVGLPLAVEFGRKFRTIGLDVSTEKVKAYRRHVDPTGEITTEELAAASLLEATTDAAQLRAADVIIVAVPTPIDDAHLGGEKEVVERAPGHGTQQVHGEDCRSLSIARFSGSVAPAHVPVRGVERA